MQKVRLDKKAIISIVVYAIFLIEILFIAPIQIKRFSSLHSKVRDLRKKVTQAKNDLNSKDKFIQDKEKIKLDIVELESGFIASGDISSVLSFISRKAKENAVDVLEITQSSTKLYTKIGSAKIYSLPIKVKAQAGFHNLSQYLNALQDGYYFLSVDELFIKGNSPYHKAMFVLTALFKE